MTTNNNPDALFADAEILFGHPGRRLQRLRRPVRAADSGPSGEGHHPLRRRRPAPLRRRAALRRLHRPTGPSGRMPRLFGTRRRGPAGPGHPLRGLLPPLPPGDQRHRLRRVAPGGPAPMPTLRKAWVVTNSKGRRRPDDPETHPTEVNVGTENATDNFRTLPN